MAVEFIEPTLVSAVARLLERRAANSDGISNLAERRDLEPVAVAAMSVVFPGRAEKDRKVAIPGWERVGRVDLVVRQEAGSDEVAAVAELKWCSATNDVLFESVWDLFKVALATKRNDHPSGYLLTGAPRRLWDQSPFSVVFDDGQLDSTALCHIELPDASHTLTWDAALEGGYDSYPDAIPARIGTRGCGRSEVGDWELRAIEVQIVGQDMVPMNGGWPHGERPARAKHPAHAPASRFVDMDEDIQIDPATLPENRELLRLIDQQIGEASED